MTRTLALREAGTGRVVCRRCEPADTVWTRFRGLQMRRALAPGEGLLLRPAGSIHTLFMRFAIDVVFLDRDLRVLEVRAGLRPWRMASVRGAKVVLELPAGAAEAAGIRAGSRLELA